MPLKVYQDELKYTWGKKAQLYITFLKKKLITLAGEIWYNI